MLQNISKTNLLNTQSALIVIPHSTDGFMHNDLVQFLIGLNLGKMVPSKAVLGTVKVLSVRNAGELKFIVLACTNNGSYSNYSVIKILMDNVLAFIGEHPKVDSATIPLMGSGGGGLDPVKIYFLLNRMVVEGQVSKKVSFCTLEETSITAINEATAPDANIRAVNLAFEYNLEDVQHAPWARELVNEKDFYFELARKTFDEFKNTASSDPDFFVDLERKFISSKTVFQDFLKTFTAASAEYRFLLTCGRLIAYIDRNGFNKQRWNEYDDKRTMALSSVNQTNWIKNLLKYKIDGNDLSRVSPSIANALRFLTSPMSELIMLSEAHRKSVSEKILHINYSRTGFINAIRQYFDPRMPVCHNPANQLVLYTRVLYSLPVKLLWDDEKESRLPVVTDTIVSPPHNVAQDGDVSSKKALKALIHSDKHAEVDMLGYQNYAGVIASFLTSKHTTPPLTIGILAPWGKGKTSLMKFIVEKIKGRSVSVQEADVSRTDQPYSSRYTIYKLLSSAEKLQDINRLSYPVVWFNAWKFQKNEQIWAGLAHEIIQQLAANLSPLDREKFYLRLNLKRIDRDRIRQSITFGALTHLILPALIAFVVFLISLPFKDVLVKIADILTPGLAGISSFILGGIINVANFVRKTPGADLAKYVMQPEYKSKMGYYSAVEEDLRHALDILADNSEPPVIFIDDLDRCSPGTITELIEAINLFTSGDISTCYFIIGQDAQIVAGALDSSYEKVGQKIAGIDKQHGSIGWFFMEKFVQLQFNIPIVTINQSQKILTSLLTVEQEKSDNNRQESLLSQYAEVERSIATLDDIDQVFSETLDDLEDEIMAFAPEKVSRFYDLIVERAIKEYKVEESSLDEVVKFISPYVKNSPRLIKRFANLYIFCRFLKYTGNSRGLRRIDDLVLGRWVLIMIRWPQLVRAIQWESEQNFLNGSSAEDRAIDFEKQIRSAGSASKWVAAMKAKKFEENSWLCSRELFDFFHDNRLEDSNLNIAVQSGLW